MKDNGNSFVTIIGISEMPKSSAGNFDSQKLSWQQVCKFFYRKIFAKKILSYVKFLVCNKN